MCPRNKLMILISVELLMTFQKTVPAQSPKMVNRHLFVLKITIQKLKIEGPKESTSETGITSTNNLNVVAIVDPPRAGLHPTVIKALRTHTRQRRLVYISCNPESLVANAIELCTPSPAEIGAYR
ncbi:hypothetical protein RYX36_006915 [Vicia faba]